MFLSKVILQPRSPAAQRILSDLYRQHQFVLTAFPDRSSVQEIVESATGKKPSALYRMETSDHGSQLFLLVQSDEEPDWERSNDLHPSVILTACTKQVAPAFTLGQILRFRLRANPTMMHANGDFRVRANHKRGGLYKEPEQLDWLERHAGRSGFRVVRDAIRVTPLGVMTGQKPSTVAGVKSHTVKCLLVDFDGMLTIDNPEAFFSAYQQGIGRGKAWGCGLLSVARV